MDYGGKGPLEYAIVQNHPDKIKFLLYTGVKYTTNDVKNILFNACRTSLLLI